MHATGQRLRRPSGRAVVPALPDQYRRQPVSESYASLADDRGPTDRISHLLVVTGRIAPILSGERSHPMDLVLTFTGLMAAFVAIAAWATRPPALPSP
jgi:hypothetical protein